MNFTSAQLPAIQHIFKMKEEKMELNKVNIVGDKFVHVYKNDIGEILEVECTENDYLSIKQNGVPTKKGYVWEHSVKRPKYDTPSGNIEDNQYALYGNTDKYFVKLPEKIEFEIEKDRIVSSQLDVVEIQDKIEMVRDEQIISIK